MMAEPGEPRQVGTDSGHRGEATPFPGVTGFFSRDWFSAAMTQRLFAAAMAILGLIALLSLAPLDGVQPGKLTTVPALISGALLIALATTLQFSSSAALAGRLLALYWIAWLVAGHAPRLAASPLEFPLWVGAAEAMTLAALSLLAGERSNPTHTPAPLLPYRAGRLAYGLMLAIFGYVHFAHRDAIAGMIPSIMPGRNLVPLITGGAMLLAAGALITNLRARHAAALIGLLFLSWVPLVHIGRLLADPSAGEFTFAAMAVTLAAGALMMSARR